MKRFFDIAFDIKEYLLLSLFVIISLILIFTNDNFQIRFLRAVAITSFGTIQSGISAIPNIFALETENKLLRENNIRLAKELADLKEAKLENIRLTKLLNFKEKSHLSLVGGKIINKSLVQTRNTITLNIGESDSVFIGMPVITDDGLVGRIVATSAHYSIAQILLNRDLKVTVKDQRSRIDGILSYDGSSDLLVKNVPKSADVSVGDVIITSEYSNLFPPGIPVAVVVEVGHLDNLFRKVVAVPLVNFHNIEEVFVVKYIPSNERSELEKTFKK
ncbi:MAG: rod shape-determining protein MreC [Ignavibacteria bacterium]